MHCLQQKIASMIRITSRVRLVVGLHAGCYGNKDSPMPFSPQISDLAIVGPTVPSPKMLFSCWQTRSMETSAVLRHRPSLFLLSRSTCTGFAHLMALDKSQEWLFHCCVYECAWCSTFWKVIICR